MTKMLRSCLVATLGLCLTSSLLASQVGTATPDTAAITAIQVAPHLRFILDSARDRDTPSQGLERTADYWAVEFKRLGLKAAIGDSAWIQRYRVPASYDLDRAGTQINLSIRIEHHDKPVIREPFGEVIQQNASASFATAAWPITDVIDQNWRKRSNYTPVTVLVTGRHTVQSLQPTVPADRRVLYIPPAGIDSLHQQQIIDALCATSSAVVIVAVQDSATFTRHMVEASRRPLRGVEQYVDGQVGQDCWIASVWPPTIRNVLDAANIDATAAQADTTPVVRKLPMDLEVSLARDDIKGPPQTAPNVIAVLEGSDPQLKNEFIAISAHIDNGGAGSKSGDNAAGAVGLLALARAFSQPGARPKRSLLFLAMSGGAKNWWGARFFEDGMLHPWYPVLGKIVASLSLNSLAGAALDSVVVEGMHDFATGNMIEWIAGSHPELGLTVIDGGPVDHSRANQKGFTRIVKPSLSLHEQSGHGRVGDANPLAIDEDRLARVLRLAFYLCQHLADFARASQWSEEGHRRLRETLGD